MTPRGQALLEQTAETLRTELAAQLAGETRYLALLAANAVAIAAREAACSARLTTLASALDGISVAAIRAGHHDADVDLHARLTAHAAVRAWIADPSTLNPAEIRTHLEQTAPCPPT